MNDALRSRPWLAGALAALPLSLWIVGPTLGRWKTPGAPEEALFEALLGAEAPLGATSPLAALLMALLGVVTDPAMAMGLVVFLAVWAAGLGGWRFGLTLGASGAEGATPWASALIGCAALQLSPAVLRAACTGELAALAVGPLALAWALPGRAGAVASALAAAWSWPAGLLALLAGPRQGLRWALVIPALALTLWGASEAPLEPPGAAVMAYVSDNGATLPLPLADAPAPPPVGLRGALRGLHVGLAGWLGAALALALGPRALGLAGLVLGAGVLSLAGPMPDPGLPAPAQAGYALPAFGEGGLAWAASGAVAGAAGLAQACARWSGATLPAVALVAFSALVENPRLALPVSNLPPDPGVQTLARLDPGAVVVFPSAEPPWRQPGRGPAEQAWRLRDVDKPLAEAPRVAGLVGRLAAVSGARLALGAGPLVWDGRRLDLAALRGDGVAYLLVDKPSLPPDGRGPLEAWLAEQVGAPLAEGDDYALYTLAKEGEADNP